MKINLSNKDIIWSYIGTFMSMFANIIMIPIMVYFLDSDMLGLWYVFSSIGAMTALFDFGFSTTFARNITYCWAGADKLYKEKISLVKSQAPNYFLLKNVIAACKNVYFIIAGSAFLLLITLGSYYISFITEKLNGNIHFIAWIIYVLAIFLNLYYGYYISFLRGIGAIKQVNKNITYARVLQIIITIILLFEGFGIIATCIGYLLYGYIFRFLSKKDFYNYQLLGEKIKEYNIEKNAKKEIFNIIWHNAWRDGLVSLSNYLNDQAVVIIISLFLTLSQTAIFSLGLQIATAIGVIASIQYTAQQPAIQTAYINKDYKNIRKIMSQIINVLFLLFIFLTGLNIYIGLPILKLIKPEINITVSFFICLCLYQFLLRLRNCYTSYFSCTNRVIYLKSFIVSSVLSIILSFILLKYFNANLYGVIFSQIFSQIIFNCWYWPQEVHEELEINFYNMIKIYWLDKKIYKLLKF